MVTAHNLGGILRGVFGGLNFKREQSRLIGSISVESKKHCISAAFSLKRRIMYLMENLGVA